MNRHHDPVAWQTAAHALAKQLTRTEPPTPIYRGKRDGLAVWCTYATCTCGVCVWDPVEWSYQHPPSPYLAHPVTLTMPAVAGLSVLDAALTYAAAGFYVAPTDPADAKNPGSLLHKDWPAKTSREADQIRLWFEQRPDALVALHTGRSGVVAFDVDDPEHVPEQLARAITAHLPPYQQSREEPGRGHFVFTVPAGVKIGCKQGALRTRPTWGEVKGGNSVILAAPSTPGRRWVRDGTVPELPAELVEALLWTPPRLPRSPGPASPVQSAERIRGLLATLLAAQVNERHATLYWCACRFGEIVAEGGVDHDDAVAMLTDAAGQVLPDDRAEEVARTVEDGLNEGQADAT